MISAYLLSCSCASPLLGSHHRQLVGLLSSSLVFGHYILQVPMYVPYVDMLK